MSAHPPDEGPRWLAWALIPVSMLSNPAAALPWGSYFFRDFGIALLPYRLFTAREWVAGRWPSWNPYLNEGTFLVPAFYLGDLAHTLWPGPVLISWILTLHFPLAALAAYLLARDLGAGRRGALVVGSLYSLGGLAVASLNLYVFLQALAWAPALAVFLRRGALRGGRWVAAAALVVGLALPILALEFLGQGVALGAALAFVERPRREVALRFAASLALGIGIAAVPLALTLGILPETTRGAGFARTDALEGEIPPAALVQTFVLGLFGSPVSPFEGWWGPFFRSGSPYFLTLYLGPLALALAGAGVPSLDRPRRLVLLAGLALSVWFALGDVGGLAPLAQSLPLARSFRSPAKAFLFTHLAVSLLAGLGLERLARRNGWTAFAAVCALLGLVGFGLAGLLIGAPDALAASLRLPSESVRDVRWIVVREALQAVALAFGGLIVAGAVMWAGRLRAGMGALLIGAAAILDLARSGAGVNPQVRTAFYDLLPELAPHVVSGRGGGRVFTYGIRWSPAFRADLLRRKDRSSRWIFWLNRQMLSPFTNMLDGVESAESPDLSGWGAPVPELLPADYDPAAIDRILPRLRAAAVSRVLSLDALHHDALPLIARLPVPRSELAIHVYAVRGAVPVASFACHAVSVASQEQAFGAATGPRFDQTHQVALEERVPDPGCGTGSVREIAGTSTLEAYETESDGPGYLVMRRGFARGWLARVDGVPVPVLRANGKYRAVRVPAGVHQVVFRYQPPGLWPGLTVCAASIAVTALVALRRQ